MKKRVLSLLMVSIMVCSLFTGCGSKKDEAKQPAGDQQTIPDSKDDVPVAPDDTTNPDDSQTEKPPVVENHDNDIRSELTNLWIPDTYEDARPIAIMTPNDKAAILSHYALSKAGIIYQCTVEGNITRLMCMYDDYEALGDRVGNVRSARLYYIYWALEWDSLFIHFGGPYYIDDICKSGLVADIDLKNMTKGTEESAGTLSEEGYRSYYFRAADRKSPQNAYTSSGAIANSITSKGYSKTHTSMYKGAHYQFADEENPVDLSKASDSQECLTVDFSGTYTVDDTYFMYDADSQTYLRFQYDEPHIDQLNGEQLAFKNIIVQFCNWRSMDAKGYLEFYFKESDTGYYITDGYAIPITWEKDDDYALTKYYDMDGNELTINTGKTMICIVKNTDKDKVEIN